MAFPLFFSFFRIRAGRVQKINGGARRKREGQKPLTSYDVARKNGGEIIGPEVYPVFLFSFSSFFSFRGDVCRCVGAPTWSKRVVSKRRGSSFLPVFFFFLFVPCSVAMILPKTAMIEAGQALQVLLQSLPLFFSFSLRFS